MKKTGPGDGQSFEQIALSSLRQKRRGKHHELVNNVLAQLRSVADESALRIPLSELKGVSAPDFRSALSRGADSEGMRISTYSDAEYFYVWVRSTKTREYERKRSPQATRRSK